ncbi:MAG: hypothetical protein MSIBF_01435 [Candidatus Altiarchaeales archaeon IMC4]|nr:MAG: hypothetical protein MSIBF_01435 [Candidatus Altiarchaeales archaeon IMC4]
MNYKYVIDAYAWIEYFSASSQGKAAKRYIESGESATPAIVLAELADKYEREHWPHLEEDLKFIKKAGLIIDLDEGIALSAGKSKNKLKKRANGFGMVDAIILATALAANAKIVTGDEHFRGFKEAIMIKQKI